MNDTTTAAVLPRPVPPPAAALWLSLLAVAYWWAAGGGTQGLAGWLTWPTSLGRLTGLAASDLLLAQVLLMARRRPKHPRKRDRRGPLSARRGGDMTLPAWGPSLRQLSGTPAPAQQPAANPKYQRA